MTVKSEAESIFEKYHARLVEDSPTGVHLRGSMVFAFQIK